MKKIIVYFLIIFVLIGCNNSTKNNDKSSFQNTNKEIKKEPKASKKKIDFTKPETLDDILKDRKTKPDGPYKGKRHVKTGMKIAKLDEMPLVKYEDDGDNCEIFVTWNEDDQIIHTLVHQYIHLNKLKCMEDVLGKKITDSGSESKMIIDELGYKSESYSICDDIRKPETERLKYYTEDMVIYISSTIPHLIGENYKEYFQQLLDDGYMSNQRYLRSIGK